MYFQTHQSASAAAIRMATQASPTGRAAYIQFSGGVHRERAVVPFEGGNAFAAEPLEPEGWTVTELTPDQLAARIIIGRRRAIDDLLELAAKSRRRAEELLGSKFAERHNKEARRLVLAAETLLNESTDEHVSEVA